MPSEIGVRLTGDNSAFRAMLADSVEKGGKFSGDIAAKVGGKLFELKDVSNTIAAALGINLVSIAENIARTITGISKVEEEAFKNLEEASAQVADLNIKNARMLLTEEQRYQLTLQDRDRLMRAIAENEGKTAVQLLKQKQDELKLAEKVTEINAYVIKQTEEQRKAVDELIKLQIAGNEKRVQAELAALEPNERIARIKESIIAMEAVLLSDALEKKNAQQIQNQLAERQNQLVAEETKLRDAARARDEEASKRTVEARKQLSVLKYEELKTEEKIAIVEEAIAVQAAALAKARSQGVVTVEIEVGLLESRKELGELQAKLESERTSELKNQTEEIARQISALAELQKRVQQFESRGTPYEGQSTTALEGVESRIKAQLTQAQQSRFGQIGGVGQIGGLGKSPLEYGLESQLAAVQKELAQRRAVGDVASRFGEDAARQQFGDTLTDRALRDLQDSSTRTSVAIQDIQQRLALVFKK